MRRWLSAYSASGLFVGGMLGYFQPELQGFGPVEQQARWFLAFQMGLAFAILFILIDSYLSWRKSVLQRLGGKPKLKG